MCLQSCQGLVDLLMNDISGRFGLVTNCVDIVIPSSSSASVVQVSVVNMYVCTYVCMCVCVYTLFIAHYKVVVWCFAIQDCLLAFVEMAQTNYGCVLVDGKVCIATDSW